MSEIKELQDRVNELEGLLSHRDSIIYDLEYEVEAQKQIAETLGNMKAVRLHRAKNDTLVITAVGYNERELAEEIALALKGGE